VDGAARRDYPERVRRIALVIVIALVGCGGAQRIPSDAKTTTLSIRNADCVECGEGLVKKLKGRAGIYDVRFDKRKAELYVTAAPAVDALAAAKEQADRSEGYDIVAGAGQGLYQAWAKVPEGADVREANKEGEDVPDLAALAVPGKVTVVDFGALWCQPCRTVDAHMLELVKARRDVAYRKLDVGDWDTPLAKRHLQGVSALPYVVVFDKRGAKVDAVTGLDLARLDRAIETGAR
jgi:thiol-disulfide isomerase/thioredoxin